MRSRCMPRRASIRFEYSWPQDPIPDERANHGTAGLLRPCCASPRLHLPGITILHLPVPPEGVSPCDDAVRRSARLIGRGTGRLHVHIHMRIAKRKWGGMYRAASRSNDNIRNRTTLRP